MPAGELRREHAAAASAVAADRGASCHRASCGTVQHAVTRRRAASPCYTRLVTRVDCVRAIGGHDPLQHVTRRATPCVAAGRPREKKCAPSPTRRCAAKMQQREQYCGIQGKAWMAVHAPPSKQRAAAARAAARRCAARPTAPPQRRHRTVAQSTTSTSVHRVARAAHRLSQ